MPKATLTRIPEAKRARIFEIAAAEFARKGFHGANVADMAQRAGIAKGAIYLYFESKLDLYRETLRDGAEVLAGVLEEVAAAGGTVEAQLRGVYTRATEAMGRYPDRMRMYCDLYTGSDPELVAIAPEIEAASATFYRRLVAEGQASGEVRADLPVPLLALLLDDLFVNYFAAHVCGYQASRLRTFWPEVPDPVAELARHVEGMLAFLTAGLAPPAAATDAPQEDDHE